ncbi:MAG: hypothetical protein KDA86_12605 [Planctomycetaceae bacterium]|nr:hypothetical protein [Planctomycetaceae bacterium]
MCRSLQRFTFVVFSLVFTFATLCSTTNAEDKPRLKIVMASPQGFLDDLEYLVVDLAEEKKQWDDNIYPSLDIFLIGVERTAPLRFDILLSDAGEDDKSGYRYQPCIPVEAGRKGLKDFIGNNLNPIGIDEKLKKRGYYELTGNVFQGWMRILDGDVSYACIAAAGHEDDIPKEMPLPEESHKDILAKGYDLGFEVLNTADQTELRKKQADDFVPYLMKDVAKKPDETEVWFNFRKTSQLHKYQQLHRMYVEAKQGTIGWTTDVAQKQGVAEFVLKALPETGLFDFIQTMGAEPSRFAAIKMAEDPVLGLRLNLPFDDFRRVQLDEWYPAARAAAKDKIDGSDEFAEEEREPAKQATDLLFDMLAAGDPLGRLDMFMDITRAESGKLGIVGGVRARDGKAADEIVKLIPKLHQEWSVVMDSEMIGDTAIHTLDVTNDTPKAIFDYFGDSGIVYVGTSAELVWIAGGEGAYEALKANIEKVSSGDSEADATPEKFVDLKLQAGPLVSFADDLADETDWNLMGVVDIKPPGSAIGASGDKEAKTLQPVDPNEIRKIVRRSLLVDSEDRITGVITRTDDYIGGKMTFAPGVLRAAGKVVAKIVSDNLQ